ncbi:MAG: TonB-dependent receptor plug domain-containing protein, partial [Burkholderiales bacterium]
MNRRFASAFVLTLAAASPQALAADETPQSTGAMLTERDFLVEIPRVISASRLPQTPSDSPGAVTVIDREMIRASGARTVAELFRMVPGFIVGFPSGSRPVVAYHGLSGQFSQRMQVLLDGRSLYAPYLLGGIDWSTLPVELDEIERVEVLRGSNSASYGANAFLGVANIVTRSAAQSRGSHFSAAAGSRNVADAFARYGAGGGTFNWRLAAGTRGDDGLAGAHDSWRSDYASLRAEWQPTGIDELSLIAGVADNRSGIGSARLAADPPRDERTRSSHLLVRWRRAFAADHEMSLTASSTVDEGDDRFSIPATPTDALVIDYGRFARRDHFEYQHYLSLSDALRSSWGAEYRSDRVTARQLFNRPEAQRSESVR